MRIRCKVIVLLGVLLLCTSCDEVEQFETSIVFISDNGMEVDCSDEVNRGKTEVDDVLHVCEVTISPETEIVNRTGQPVPVDRLRAGDEIRITLLEPTDIGEENRSFTASKLQLLTSER
ncbi:hypothetical protein [Marinicrinis sediminis]|uniref:DUF3221 domain-containing protein n=1 Tax=Marinicrinis sediminis TaxID=1652465 RepID=A0ABW5REG9_9BACL